MAQWSTLIEDLGLILNTHMEAHYTDLYFLLYHIVMLYHFYTALSIHKLQTIFFQVFFINTLCVLPVCMPVYNIHAWCPHRDYEIRFTR